MNLGATVIRLRWPIFIVSAALLAFAVIGASKLTVVTDPYEFFAEDDPQLISLFELENRYSKSHNGVFVLVPEDGSVFTRNTLEAVEWLTEKGWQLPYSSRVDSLSNYQHTTARGDELVVEALYTDPQNLSEGQLERIKKIALNEPSLLDNIVSRTGHVTAVDVNFIKKDETLAEQNEIKNATRKLASEFEEKFPDIKLRQTGWAIIDPAFKEVAEEDMATLIPAMLLVMIAVIWISLRSFSATLGTVVVMAMSAATALGIGGWLGTTLSDVSSLSPTIILTLAVADSIHILTTLFDEMRDGKTKEEAIVESLRLNFHPIALTSVTTAIGFLTLNFSDSPPFHDLGNLVAMGVLAAFVYSVTLLPALIYLLPVKVKGASRNSGAFFDRLGNFVVKRRRAIFLSMTILILVLGSGITRIELDDNFIEYIDEKHQVRRDSEFISKNLTGQDALEFSLSAGEAGGVNEPAYLAKLEEFAQWFRKQSKVTHVSYINDVFKNLNKSMHGDDPAWYRIPDSRELAAQYLLLYEMSLPFGLDLTTQVNIDKSATRFIAILTDMTSMEIIDLEQKANHWLEENAPKSMHTKAGGLSVMFSHITENNLKSMLFGTIFALILISVILIFSLKDARVGFISLVPNLVPALMAFGLWGLLVGRVGLAAAIIAPMTLGIVVDDTIHFLSKYVRARKELGKNPEEAVRYSFHTVGKAIFITSVVLSCGFLVLALSSFWVNTVMGILSAIAISFALLTDFLFLPPLLMKAEELRSSNKP